jgi:hypothetical protein
VAWPGGMTTAGGLGAAGAWAAGAWAAGDWAAASGHASAHARRIETAISRGTDRF